MKYFISILLISFLSLTNYGQQKQQIKVYGMPLDTIAHLVKKHPKYFTHLSKKIQVKNKKMTQDELIMLYYGSAFMKNYHPKEEEKAVDKIAKQMAELDFSGAIVEGNKMLKIYPVNARLYMLLGYAYKKIGEKNTSKWFYKRYADIIRIPLYSSSGKSFDEAFVVRSVSDEYLILNQKKLELTEQSLRYHNHIPYDVLQVQPESKNNKRAQVLSKQKLYFNIYLPFFIGQGKTFKSELEEAKKKYKIKETHNKK